MDMTTVGNIALVAVTCLGMWVAAMWIALVIWTFRDHRARSRDGLASFAAAVMVALLSIPGALIYLLLRPRETLVQTYERSLEEEALLQDIEEKPLCPGCGRPSDAGWQVCPHCHTILKKACISCKRMLDLTWSQCPFCATVQPGVAQTDMRPVQEPAGQAPQYDLSPPAAADYYSAPAGQSLEYIDDDPYQP